MSCQRCDKYICFECSTPGAVGFLCPEDAKDKIKTRKANFQKGIVSSAPMTFTLMGINLLVYVCQLLFPNIIESLYFANVGSNLEWGSLQRIFTSAFTHSEVQITHILFNMYSLFVLGTLLEPMLGKWRFLTLYFFSIFGGGLGFMLLATPGGYVVGASGAIFGLMGAYLIFLLVLKLNASQMYVIIGINLFLGFLPGIAWEAHVGGLLAGSAVGYLLISTKDKGKKNLQIIGLVAIAIVLVAIWIMGNTYLNDLYK